MAEKDVSYGINADASGFQSGMEKAAGAAKNAAGDINKSFKGVQEAVETVTKQIAIMAGIVAGGSFFKEAIAESNAMTGEAKKLAMQLGITGEEASTLKTALGDIGSSGDEYTEAFQKFAKQLRTNEQGMNDLGIKTRDANGHLRNSNELFTEALHSVGQYKGGLDQITYAQTLFGKSVDDALKLQRLNNEVLADAQQKNEELGLTITQQNVQAAKAYKAAMNDVGDVMDAVKKTVGDAVMPVFTDLGNYFASTGPYVVSVFKGAMMGLLAAFEVVKGAVRTVTGTIFEAFNTIIEGGSLMGEVLANVLSGDFKGAYEAGQRLGQRIKQGYTNIAQNFIDSGNDVDAAVKAHYDRLYGDKQAMDSPKSGTKRMGEFGKGGSGKDTSRMGQWETELAEQKLFFQEQQNLQGSFATFGKQAELQYWQDKLKLTQNGSQENLALRRKVAELELTIGQDAYQTQLANYMAEQAGYRNNADAKLAILNQALEIVKQRYGTESKEYEKVQKEIVATKRMAEEQKKQIDQINAQSQRDAQLSELSMAQQHDQLLMDLGEITHAQMLQRLAEYEDRRNQIAIAALNERLQIAQNDPDRNVVEIAQIHQQMEQAEREHQQRMLQIRSQAAVESASYSRMVTDSISNSFQSSLSQMLQGSMSFRNFQVSIWKGMQASIAELIAKMVVDYIKNTVIMAGVSRMLALFGIGTNAAKAGAAAAASAAETPVVGWLTAPVAAASTFAMAAAFAGNVPSFSAAGGFDIPSNINPIVQTHAREMILPDKHADVIRRMADAGEGGSSSGGDVHLHVNAVDARSVARLFESNGAALAAALKQQVRNGAL